MAPGLLIVATWSIVALAAEEASIDSCSLGDSPTCRSEAAKGNVLFQARASVSKDAGPLRLTEWHDPLTALDDASDAELLSEERAFPETLVAASKLADATLDGRPSTEELLASALDNNSSGGVDSEELKQEAQASSAGIGDEFVEEDAAVDFSGRYLQADAQADALPETLLKASKLADANLDGRLSSEELMDFALAQRATERRSHVMASWKAVAAGQNLSFDALVSTTPPLGKLEGLRDLRFRAADGDGDGALSLSEYHSYLHPIVDDAVFAADRDFHFATFDRDASGGVDLEEFKQEARASSAATGGEFSEEDALLDFRLHDGDADGALSASEFGSMLRGDERLRDSIRSLIEAVDRDGDMHMHLQEEMALERLLDSEFVEDFFLNPRLQEL